jgi:mRNA interferase MazF
MKEGDVILAKLAQGDGRQKKRPVVILRELPSYGDLLVCGISSQLHQYVRGVDQIIQPTEADFGKSGLLRTFLIRVGHLAVVPRTSVAGAIGSISPERHKRLLRTLSNYLTRDI